VIFHLLDEPVPTLSDSFPRDDPHLTLTNFTCLAGDVTIWYTVTGHDGQEVISVQHVNLDT
jgi:hypothetical protein